jgi:hypothetical protein
VISPRETAMRGPASMAGRAGASRVIASASSGGVGLPDAVTGVTT